jgi:SAP domain
MQMKAVQLKEICEQLKLKKSGKKADLQDRIRDYYSQLAKDGDSKSEMEDSTFDDHLDTMGRDEIIAVARTRNLPTHGSHSDIIQRIREDTNMIKALREPKKQGQSNALVLSKLLENSPMKEILAAHQDKESNKESKYVDVTISSLGLKAEKFTTSGMPSVTADVIRALAGDPFANPPKYGTVRA